jgi:hypothetical protein
VNDGTANPMREGERAKMPQAWAAIGSNLIIGFPLR